MDRVGCRYLLSGELAEMLWSGSSAGNSSVGRGFGSSLARPTVVNRHFGRDRCVSLFLYNVLYVAAIDTRLLLYYLNSQRS